MAYYFFYRKYNPDKFIKIISGEPCLWDVDFILYKNFAHKEKTWMRIGEMFELTAYEAQAKFKALRDRYRREKNRQIENPDYKHYWRYMKAFSFLDNVRTRAPKNNTSQKIKLHNLTPDFRDFLNNANTSQSSASVPTNSGNLYNIPKPLTIRTYAGVGNNQQKTMNNIPERTQVQGQPKSNFQQVQAQQPPRIQIKLHTPQTNNPMNNYPSHYMGQVSVGKFIDEMVRQEPIDSRERFSIELLDAFTKLKRQYVEKRQKCKTIILK